MKICMSMILCNSEETIEKVILSWVNKVDQIICLLNNSTDKTEEILKKYPVKILKCKWQGFAITRNICLSYCKNYDFNIHVDDSYELFGSFDRLRYLKYDPTKPINLRIKCEGLEYVSARIIPKKCRAKYINEIHEVLDINPSCVYQNAFINDIQSNQGKIRTQNRVLEDFKILSKYDDSRSKYYRAMCSVNMYCNEQCDLNQLLEALDSRIECSLGNLEESFLCSMMYATFCNDEEKSLKMLILASLIYPKRRAEPFFSIYEIKENLYYLEKAYIASKECIDNNYFDEFCIPIRKEIYTNLIPSTYADKFVSNLV